MQAAANKGDGTGPSRGLPVLHFKITDGDKNKIMSKSTKDDMVRVLLDTLPRNKDREFVAFCKASKEDHEGENAQPWLADTLEKKPSA